MRSSPLWLSILLLLGCQEWYGESPLPVPTADLNQGTESTCQIPIDKLSDDFLNATLSASEVDSAIACAETLVYDLEKHVETKTEGTMTRREIETLLNTHVLGDPETLTIWIDRLFSLRNLLIGQKESMVIYFQDLYEIFRRAHLSVTLIAKLSHSLSDQKTTPQELTEYKNVRKETFSTMIQIMESLLTSQDGLIKHDIEKSLLLNQYQLWEGLDKEVGAHYIEAGYLANRVIFGRDDKTLLAGDVKPLLRDVEAVYHRVTDINHLLDKELWKPQDSLSFLYAYERLLNYLFDRFLSQGPTEIKKGDLITLLELLHADVGGKALDFVDAVMEFKKQVFGGTSEILTKVEIKTLLQASEKILQAYAISLQPFGETKTALTQQELLQWLLNHKAELNDSDYSHLDRMMSDIPNIFYCWTTPFKKTDRIDRNRFSLSQVALTIIDQVILAYDRNNDGMLALRSLGEAEIDHLELTSLLMSVQKLLKGLDHLTEGAPADTEKGKGWSNPLNLDPVEFGTLLITLADQFLLTSDGDHQLNRYEVAEVTSFLLENSRAVTWFYYDEEVLPHHAPETPDPDSKGLIRQSILPILKEVSTLEWYFPNLVAHLSKSQSIAFAQTLAEIVGREDPVVISLSELEFLFGLVRLIETLFLRYDINENGILDDKECEGMYAHFAPFMEQLLTHSDEKAYDSDVIKKIAKLLTSMVKHLTQPLVSEHYLYRKAFMYAVTYGRFPQGLGQLLFAIRPEQSDRMEIAKLFKDIADILKLSE